MVINVVSLVALVLSLSGNILINFKKRFGFVVWFLSNVCWIVVNLLGKPNWLQIIMFIVYMALNVQGWLKWKRK